MRFIMLSPEFRVGYRFLLAPVPPAGLISARYDDALAFPTILVPLVQPGGLGKAHL